MSTQPSIFSRGFLLLCLVNLLAFTAFFMLIPVLPVYLLHDLHAGRTATGILLALYVLAALLVRPLSGFIVDSFPRKPVFLACTALFACVFPGYLCITQLVLLGALRTLHGMAFGLYNTSSSTLVVDIVPAERLGTGIGIFSLTTAVSMALGPMLGLLLYENTSPDAVFQTALGLAAACALLGLFVPATHAPRIHTADARKGPAARFFLPRAGRAAFSVACASFCYGLVLNYISVFVREQGLDINAGWYFCVMAVGMVITRMCTGRLIDGGKLLHVMTAGMTFIMLSATIIPLWNGIAGFFVSATLMGLGIGVIMPAAQTMFVHLARPDQRGVANSSFFISWDAGIAAALFAGGFAAELLSFGTVFLCGSGVLLWAIAFFVRIVGPAYRKDTQHGPGNI